MALSTYTELQAAIATWLRRSTMSSQIVDFIALGESRLNQRLRLLQQETEATITLSSGSRTAALPTGFLEHIDLRFNSDDWQPQKTTWAYMSGLRQVDSATGRPSHFVIGSQFTFNTVADQEYTLKHIYLKKWDLATDETNWLLTNAPGCYLYAALLEAKAYAKNKADAVTWAEMLAESIKDVNTLAGRTRATSEMRHDSGIAAAGRFDIERGY